MALYTQEILLPVVLYNAQGEIGVAVPRSFWDFEEARERHGAEPLAYAWLKINPEGEFFLESVEGELPLDKVAPKTKKYMLNEAVIRADRKGWIPKELINASTLADTVVKNRRALEAAANERGQPHDYRV